MVLGAVARIRSPNALADTIAPCTYDSTERAAYPVPQENPVRKLIATSFLCLCALFLAQAPAHAQQIDVAFGGNTLIAPPATSTAESLRGGFYPTISGDVLFYHHLGVGGEISWRGSKNVYPTTLGPFPYRPVMFDIGAVYAPPLPFHFVQPQLEAGIGAEDIRFYSSSFCNPYTGSCYASSKHFMGRLGVGLKFYVFGNFFVRPQFAVYLIHNNVEFSSTHATQVGIAIGYTLGSH